MLSLSSLLNPMPSSSESRRKQLPSAPPQSSSYYSTDRPLSVLVLGPAEPQTPRRLKPKMAKDGVMLTEAKIQGEVNYPPFDDLDEKTLADVKRFSVNPLGEIRKYPRHIPYSSERRNFQERTGREAFDVFQYEFKIPDSPEDDKPLPVLWDYNNGLVRITAFFRAMKWPKTAPAKALAQNPGLKDISFSITGGALLAQGYWLPFECAKAMAAKFCGDFAPALIPIFGPDFPSLCDRRDATMCAQMPQMKIDPAIVQRAIQQAERYLKEHPPTPRATQQPQLSRDHLLTPTPSPCSPHRELPTSAIPNRTPRKNRANRVKGGTGGGYMSATDTESGLESGPNRGNLPRSHWPATPQSRFDSPSPAPSSNYRGWTPLNRGQTPDRPMFSNEAAFSANSQYDASGRTAHRQEGPRRLAPAISLNRQGGGVVVASPFLSSVPTNCAGVPHSVRGQYQTQAPSAAVPHPRPLAPTPPQDTKRAFAQHRDGYEADADDYDAPETKRRKRRGSDEETCADCRARQDSDPVSPKTVPRTLAGREGGRKGHGLGLELDMGRCAGLEPTTDLEAATLLLNLRIEGKRKRPASV